MVTTGLDKLHLTFASGIPPETLVERLFTGITLAQFRQVDNTTRGDNGPKISWYRTSYYLKTTENTVLIAIHTDPTSKFGKRNLVQIHGLTLSDSALNALRPFDMQRLVSGAIDLNAHVTAVDLYIDDHSGSTPVDTIYEQSLPHNYRQFVRSPFLKDHCSSPTIPRQFDTSVYYGRKGGNACQVLFYQKHLSPHQKIYSKENPLKFPWVRFELRLRGETAKKHGEALLWKLEGTFLDNPISMGQAVTQLFTKYFAFVDPVGNRPSRNPLQAWWGELLKTASL